MSARTDPADYLAHDAAYQQLRARGDRKGWSLPEDYERELRLLDEMLRWPGIPTIGSLLEIGCGAGNIALHLASRGWRVCGVDISPTAVAWAKEHAQVSDSPAVFRVGDVRKLQDFADDEFDLVLDGHCLHCLIGPDRAECIKSVHRVLKPSGTFLVRSMCGPVAADVATSIGFDARTKLVFRNGIPSRHIGDAAEIVKEITSCGFAEIARAVVKSSGGTDLDELLLHTRKVGTVSE